MLVMELVDAPSLHELVEREGPLPTGLVARLGLGLLDTLDAAHRQGVVHLDVTPANVLVLADGGRPVGAGRDLVLRGGRSAPVRPRRAAGDVGGGRGRPTASAAAGRTAGSGPARRAGQAAGAAAGRRAAAPAARPPRRRRRHRPRRRGLPPAPRCGCPASLRPPPGSARPRPAGQVRPVRAWLVLATALLLLGLAATLATALGRGRVRTPRPGRRAAPPRPVPSPRRPRQAAWRSATGQSRPRPTTTRSGWPSRS